MSVKTGNHIGPYHLSISYDCLSAMVRMYVPEDPYVKLCLRMVVLAPLNGLHDSAVVGSRPFTSEIGSYITGVGPQKLP